MCIFWGVNTPSKHVAAQYFEFTYYTFDYFLIAIKLFRNCVQNLNFMDYIKAHKNVPVISLYEFFCGG